MQEHHYRKTFIQKKYNEGHVKYFGNDEILRDVARKCCFINFEADKVRRRLIELRDPPIIHMPRVYPNTSAKSIFLF